MASLRDMPAVAAFIALTACGSKEEQKAGTPAPTTHATATASVAATATQAPTATATAIASAAPAAGSGLATMFAGPPSAGIKDSETIVGAGGVVLGFPARWTSGNIYWAQTAYDSKVVSSSIKGATVLCQTVEGKSVDKATIHSTLYAAQIQKETWTEEVDGVVGVEGYAAKLGMGKGEQVGGKHEPSTVYYVFTSAIPKAKPVICAGGFPTSHPELGKELVEVFKGMKNSKVKK